MVRTSSITVPSMVGIVGRAPAVDEKVLCVFVRFLFFYRHCYRAMLPMLPCVQYHAGIVFTQWSKNMFFAQQGRRVAPINVTFGMGEQIKDPLPPAKFHVYWGRNVGIQPPKLSTFRILAINLPLKGHSFAQFLRNSQILYASLGGF